jgi:acetoin utilization deacetylase AcuC-like enzyme
MAATPAQYDLAVASGALRTAAFGLLKRLRRMGLAFKPPGARLVFDPRTTLPSTLVANAIHIDGRRGERILRYLEVEGLVHHLTTIPSPRGLRIEDAMRAHGTEYLASLDDPARLERIYAIDALGGLDPTKVLAAQRFATAGTVQAARAAIRTPWLTSPVVNLGGGFHHARRDEGSGFCALNDVAIAIERVRAEGFRGNVLVVDLDFHQGDGTRRIFAEDPTVWTYSVHAQAWDDSPAVSSIDHELGPAVGDDTYSRVLEETLPDVFERAKPKLVFYVAGADVAGTDA